VRRLVLAATAPGALMVPGYLRILLRMLTPRRRRGLGYAARIAGEPFGGSAREDPRPARDLLHAVTRPALGHLAVVVGAAVAVPIADLGDAGHVERVVDAPVAA
jgi:hypothetical protein